MDRLSDLPKHILHNILSRISVREGIRTSILSKAWNHTWSTFPILNFKRDILMRPNDFINYVEKTLKRFHDRGLAIRKFKLTMEYNDPLAMEYIDSNTLNPHLDYWVRLAKESCVQELELDLFDAGAPDNKVCCLPLSIFEAKSLTKMSLWSLKVDNALKNIPIRFSSLQVLSLQFVVFGDEQIIQNIISSCPLIEQLTLYSCSTMKPHQRDVKYVRIHGLQKLKKVWANGIQEIDIDAPNLEELIYEPESILVPLKINVDNCRNIKWLDLSSLQTIITDQWFLELFDKFPLLETLKFHHCRFSERIKVSCVSLKIFEMALKSKLTEVIIDAPNLCSLRYRTCVEMPIFTLEKSLSLLQFDVILFFTRYWDFQKLREFLQGFEHIDILASLSLWISRLPEINLDVLRDVSASLPSIKHLIVKITSSFSEMQTPVPHFVTGLLWSCCPTTIFIPLEHGRIRYSVEKVLEEMLIDRKQDESCCSSSDIKCWWHSLKDVKVTRKFENDDFGIYTTIASYATFELKY